MRRVLRRLLLTGIALALAAPAFAQPATPLGTFTPAGSPSAGPGYGREKQRPSNGGDALQAPMTMEGGLQIGKTTAGGSLLTFAKAFSCAIDPASLGATPGAITTIRCAQTGLRAGDFVLCRLPVATTGGTGVVLRGFTPGTDYVDIELVSVSASFTDLPATTVACLAVGTSAR
jgi:hypothetical protein